MLVLCTQRLYETTLAALPPLLHVWIYSIYLFLMAGPNDI